MTRLEIAAETLQDAIRAQQGGADSIELSVDLSAGGLTPLFSVVRAVRHALEIDIHVIIRPTARDFVYTEPEIKVILSQASEFAALDVTGVVFGAQTAAGTLDIDLIRRVAEAANGVMLTIHRAIDTCTEPESALDRLVGFVPRVLTAGPAPTAWEGRAKLREWVARYGDRIRFVASGGLKAEQLAEYITHTRVHEVHLGSAARTRNVVDVAKVRALREIVG